MARCLCRTCEKGNTEETFISRAWARGGTNCGPPPVSALQLPRVSESYSSAAAGRPKVGPHCSGLVFGLFLYRRKQKSGEGEKVLV
ncbi:hypothetical protein XELAEV_18003796mg [Xenopus laevis]|uniref:Uncharacterized protein n=1 Tax=Xenopus laevis TaxID=8355 RepID=A0A974GY40_XENLA|nr:hypothetical protein XELAEV_18003796mg [Xenopus laevis]